MAMARARSGRSATRNAFSGQFSHAGIGVGSKRVIASGPSVTIARTAPDERPILRPKLPVGYERIRCAKATNASAAHDEAEGEEKRGVRRLERSERPEEPDDEHLRAGPVRRSTRGGDRPRDGEDEPGDEDEREEVERLRLA